MVRRDQSPQLTNEKGLLDRPHRHLDVLIHKALDWSHPREGGEKYHSRNLGTTTHVP